MSLETQAVVARRSTVRASDRIWDLVALLLLVAGTILFFIGRDSLTSLARGTYEAPAGVSWVSRAEHHDAQARWGARLIGAGLIAGVAAAGRHMTARRLAR